MNPVLLYVIKSAFYLASLYLVYTFLSKDTLYARNRVFIILSLAGSFILPLITIETSKPVMLFGKTLSEVLVLPSGNSIINVSQENGPVPVTEKVMIIYFAGLIVFAIKLILDIVELLILELRNRGSRSKIIKFNGLQTSGFSAMGKIFINAELDEDEAAEIIKHEQNHIDRHHFLDILLIEFVKVIQWFNPFAYLFNRSLRAVHEYQADEGCLRRGIPVVSYQRLILNQVFRTKEFRITNSFSNPTLIKKRMIMMTKKRSRTMANLKLLMVLPVIAIVMIAFSSCKDKPAVAAAVTEEIAPPPPPPASPDNGEDKVVKGSAVPADAPPPPPPPPPPPYTVKDGDTIWIVADKMPLFTKTGSDQEILDYIQKNIKYPEEAVSKGIQGKVYVRFTIKKDGSVSDAKIIKGVDLSLDTESLRVIQNMPPFETPGYKNGKPVTVYYTIPITFALK